MATSREASPLACRISYLELSNFKSYRGVVKLGPFRNFTAIVGPNGSGKSNVMDAISFVLGMRTEPLRGKLKELLYNDGQPRRSGYVKLVLQIDTAAEIEFCRVIQPTSTHLEANYASEYRIDEGVVTVETYHKKLQSFGVLVKARNFLVFQGDIESVAAMHPKELTKLFELLSGSNRFAKEYGRLAGEKEAAESVLMQLHGRKKHLLAEARQKKGQMAEAEKHRTAETALKMERLKLCTWRVYTLEKDILELNVERREVESEIQRQTQKHCVSEKLLTEKRRERTELTAQLSEVEGRLLGLQKTMEAAGPETIRVAEERQRLENRRDATEKKRSETQRRSEDWKRHITKLKGDLKGLESAYRRFGEIVVQEERQGVHLSTEDLDTYHKIQNHVLAITGRLQQEKSGLDASQTTARESLTRLKARLEAMDAQRATWSQSIAAIESSAAAKATEIKTLEAKIQEAHYEKRHLTDRIQEEAAKRDALRLSCEKLEKEISEAKATRRETRRDAAIAESIGSLKRAIPGVYGRVTALGKVRQSRHHLAMAVALGADLDSVLVDTRETAKRCIQYLKDHRRGPLNFLPLASIDARPIQERLRRLGGTAKLALDLLEFDGQYEVGFRFACGNAVVCDTLEEAKHLAYNLKARPSNLTAFMELLALQVGVKVVALDGTMIHKLGYITGGLSDSMESRAAKWDDDRLAGVKREKAALEKELAALPMARDRHLGDLRLTSEIAQSTQQCTYLQSELQSYATQREEKEKDAAKLEREGAKLQPEAAALQAEIAERESCIQQLKSRIDAVADREFAEFSRRVGVQNYREYEEQHLQKAKRTRQQRKEFETQIGHVRAQLEYETSRNLTKPLETLNQKIRSDAAQLHQLDVEARAAEEKQRRAAEAVDEMRKKLTELKTSVSRVELELQEFRQADEEHCGAIGRLQTKRETLQTQVALLTEQKTDTLQVEAPRSGDGESLPADWTHPTAPLDETERREIEATLLERIEELTTQLHRSAPNLKAFDQYHQIKDQETEQSTQLAAARATEHEISQAFQALHQQRYDAFMAAFQHVASHINGIYKDLTKSENHPYGGSAALYLESEETPFLSGIKFSAIPPAKRYREMDQLSGGEKTVVALALLFAMHSYKPCPFFILDEIDASLDAVNVRRVVDFIKEKSQEGLQSIVISLKDTFFHKADGLVGITRDVEQGGSQVFTFDLEAFEKLGVNE